MTPNASTLEITPNLHRVLQACHSLQDIFGYILLTMHYIQRVSYEEVLHNENVEVRFYTYEHLCDKVNNKTTLFTTVISVHESGNLVIE